MLRTLRILTWAAVFVLAGIVALSVAGVRLPGLSQKSLPLATAIGGPFELASTQGGTISSKMLAGKPFAVFFGYTFCPDVCPTTLLDLSNDIRLLGPDADRMNYVFVSVDPERDTIDQLKLYLSSFDPHIIGATGSDTAIADMARKYHAVYRKVTSKDGTVTFDHTATTYLMDANGLFHGTLTYQESQDVAVAKLRRLIAGR